MDWDRLLNLLVSALTVFTGLTQLKKDSKRLGATLIALGLFVGALFFLANKPKEPPPSAESAPATQRAEGWNIQPFVFVLPPEPVRPAKPERADEEEEAPSPAPPPIHQEPLDNRLDPPTPPVEEEALPPARPTGRAAPADVEVEALARLENFRVPDGRPFLALAEDIELSIAGRTIQMSVARRGRWRASETISLPEGEHRYTLRSHARARCYPEGGGWPFSLSLTGGGSGKILVKRGARLLLKREVCQGRHYTARLELSE